MSQYGWPRQGVLGGIASDEVVVADTETTGLAPFGLKDGEPTRDPEGPDRLCSAAFIRLIRAPDGWKIGDRLAFRVDPCRPVPETAAKVNGFAWSGDGQPVQPGREDLAGLPRFEESAGEQMLDFIGSCPLVFHNSVFDAAFIDAELVRARLPPLGVPILCTKKAFSDIQGRGRPNHYLSNTNLNALCEMLGIDRSARTLPDGTELHGAAVDAALAAACFARLEPMGWMVPERPEDMPHRDPALGLAIEPSAGAPSF